MGDVNGPYNADFPVGTVVQVVNRSDLDCFKSEWKWHHSLTPEQLEFGTAQGVVTSVSFYHGGDELYELEDIPGIWHLQCLNAVSED